MPSCLQGWALLWEGSGLCQGVGISQCAVTGTEPLCTAGSGCQEQILQRRKTKANFSITSKCSTLSHSCCETRLFFFFFLYRHGKRELFWGGLFRSYNWCSGEAGLFQVQRVGLSRLEGNWLHPGQILIRGGGEEEERTFRKTTNFSPWK